MYPKFLLRLRHVLATTVIIPYSFVRNYLYHDRDWLYLVSISVLRSPDPPIMLPQAHAL